MSISKLRTRLNVPPPQAAAPSLPPAPGETLSPSSTSANRVPAPPPRKFERDSLIKRKALAIVAMRAQGFTTEEIAAELGIKPRSVSSYLYQAGKKGFLVKRGDSLLADPKDRIGFDLAHKAIRNMNAALDDSLVTTAEGEIKAVNDRMWEATTLIAGHIPKEAAQTEQQLPQMAVLAIKIEMPTSAETLVRTGTMGGTPAYSEGEVVNECDQRD